jgi:hypothetical protein
MPINKSLFNDRIEKMKNMLAEIEYWADNADDGGHIQRKDYYNYMTYDLSDIASLSQELFENIEEAKSYQEPEVIEEPKKKKDKK